VVLLTLAFLGLGWWLGRPAPAPKGEPQKIVEPAVPEPPRYQLEVESQPPGARVYLDGYYLGEAPVRLKVEAGARLLRVEAEGYRPFEQKIQLNKDRHLKVSLTPLAKKPEKKPEEEKLVLRVRARSWIRVTTPEGKKLYEATAPPGTELSFPLPVVVRTGNAGGVVVVLSGEDKGPLGKPGEVVTRRFP
jgi:cytoskeleton protein RodZ